ncbi:MAG: cation diffusion facilitator family transporter [Promethearchaeota archaeon]
MPLTDLKSKYSRKELKFGPRSEGAKFISKYYDGHHKEPHEDLLYGFLCLIYDGTTNIDNLKSEMKVFFISATKQVIIEDNDVDEYIQKAKQKQLIEITQNQTIRLTKTGIKLVETSYHWNLHTTYWMRKFFSVTSVMLASAFFLIILSILKILTGLQLGSQGMLTEGFENLTDLIKIAIIGLVGLKFKKDRLASILIIIMMMFTGATLVWTGIESLFTQEIIIPNVQAYMIGFISIAMNAGLMYLKGMVGRNSGNLALLSDSKDSEFNIKLSLGVLIGLTFAIFKIYFIDALVGILIAALVFKEGIEIICEILKREEDFDITSIKVYADNIYENRLTGYILGSIRRESLSRKKVIENFSKGLSLGRMYYEGFADFFYDDLGPEIADKYLNKLIEGGYIEVLDEKLILTRKGLYGFYRAKVKEFKQRSTNIELGRHKIFKSLSCIIFLALLVLLIIFAPQINSWLNSF